MAPKPKVADLEAKLKTKEAELQAAQTALTKTEASRAKLKQYLEAFREQAVNTTQFISQFKQLQQDYNGLHEKHRQLEQEAEQLRQGAAAFTVAAQGASPEVGAAAGVRSESVTEKLRQQLQEDQQRGQQLQERCARLQDEQRASNRDLGHLKQERECLLQDQQQREQQWQREQRGTEQQWQRERDQHQESLRELLSQLQREQHLNQELRTQLDSAVRWKHRQEQQHGGNSPGPDGLTAEQGTRAAALTLRPPPGKAAGTAAALTAGGLGLGVAAAVRSQPTAAKVRGGAQETRATAASRRRRGGSAVATTTQSVAGSAIAASKSDSDSGVEGDDGEAKSGNQALGVREHGRQQREHEAREQLAREAAASAAAAATEQSQRRAAEAGLEAARRELEELRRREAAQRAEMEQLQSQLQALQVLLAEHTAALKRQSAHLQRHDNQLGCHGTELERQGAELRRQGGKLEATSAELGRLSETREAEAEAMRTLSTRLQSTEAMGAALRNRLEGVVSQVRGVNRTHSILRQAFGGGDAEGDTDGWRGPGEALEEPFMPENGYVEKLPSLTAAAAPRQLGPRAQINTAAKFLNPSVDASLSANPLGIEDDEHKDRHRDKRRRLEGSELVAAGRRGSVPAVQPLLPSTTDAPDCRSLPPQKQQVHGIAAAAAATAPHGLAAAAGGLRHLLPDSAACRAGHQLPALAAAPVVDAGGEMQQCRRGRGRLRKERTPREVLGTLLDGKATSAGQLSKVAAAAARKAATAVRGNALHPTTLAAAICSAVLRCSRDRVCIPSGTPSTPSTIANTAPGSGEVAAVDGLLVRNAARRPGRGSGAATGVDGSGRGDRTRGSGAAVTAMVTGGFLSMLLPSTRSHGRGGSGGVAATAGAGGLTLPDALACLWCKPMEQQRQVVRWLLQVVRDTDRLLSGDAAFLHVGGGGGGGRGRPGAAAAQENRSQPGPRDTAEGCMTDGDGGLTEAEDVAAAGAVDMEEGSGAPLERSVAAAMGLPPRDESVAVLGGRVAQRLSAVLCCPLDGGGAALEAASGGEGVLECEMEDPPSSAGAGGAVPPAASGSFPERCAAAHAVGQLFRLYQDREGFQCTALELLHAAATSRSCDIQPCWDTSTSNQQPHASAVWSGRSRTVGTCPTVVQSGSSLVPLSCLFVSWPQALLPRRVHASSQTLGVTAGDETAASVHGVGAPILPEELPNGADLGLCPAALREASCGPASAGSRSVRHGHGLPGASDGGDLTLDDLFDDGVSGGDADAFPHSVSEPLQFADDMVWVDPGREMELVSEPLVTAMMTCAQVLALERLAACCGVGTAGADEAGAIAWQQLNDGSPVGEGSYTRTGLDCQVEAVAATSLLRAVWEQQQQQQEPSRTEQKRPQLTGSMLPGVEEVLRATGAINAPKLTGVAAAIAGPAKRCVSACGPENTAGLSGAAYVDGSSKGGSGGSKARAMSVPTEFDAALATALGRGRSAILELAARLVGMLLAGVRRQQCQSNRASHLRAEVQQQHKDHRNQQRGNQQGQAASVAGEVAGELFTTPGPPADQQQNGPGAQTANNSGYAYLNSLRQALLMTCHFLPHDQVYDRVLRQLVLCLLLTVGSVGVHPPDGQRQQPRHEWSMAVAGGVFAGRAEGSAPVTAAETPAVLAAAETAASAAGSPVVAHSWEGADVLHSAAALASGGARTTAEQAAAVIAVAPSPAGPGPCGRLDLRAVRVVLEVIQDIACQALSCGGPQDSREGPSLVLPDPEPSKFSSGCRWSSGTAMASLALRLACSSMCESLAGLLHGLLYPKQRAVGDHKHSAVQAGGLGATAQGPEAPFPESGEGVSAAVGSLSGCTGEEEEGAVTTAAVLVSAVVQVAGMCVAGLTEEPGGSTQTAAAETRAGLDLGLGSSSECVPQFARTTAAEAPAAPAALPSRSVGFVDLDVKARVARALRGVQQLLLDPMGRRAIAAAAAAGLPLLPSGTERGLLATQADVEQVGGGRVELRPTEGCAPGSGLARELSVAMEVFEQ